MQKALEQKIWWLAIVFADLSRDGAAGPDAAVLVLAALLEAVARAIWLSLLQPSLLQPWRDRHHEAPCRRARVRSDLKTVVLWGTLARQAARFQTNPPKSQEHHHAYP
jgi:hypothetical protein